MPTRCGASQTPGKSLASHLDIGRGRWHDCLMTNETITFTAHDQTFTVWPEVGHYSNGRLAIKFFDQEGPFSTITTNLPDQHLNEGEVFVKDWSENEVLVNALLEAGWLTLTGREVQSGYVFPKVMRLAGPLATLTNKE